MIFNSVARYDLIEINAWYHKRDMPILKELPSMMGYIVRGVGAGFLIKTPCVSFLECFVTNKDAERSDRWKALDGIAALLIQQAHILEIKNLVAVTKNPFIVELCKKHGLNELNGMRIFGGGY